MLSSSYIEIFIIMFTLTRMSLRPLRNTRTTVILLTCILASDKTVLYLHEFCKISGLYKEVKIASITKTQLRISFRLESSIT